jgi:hypothetical protein
MAALLRNRLGDGWKAEAHHLRHIISEREWPGEKRHLGFVEDSESDV